MGQVGASEQIEYWIWEHAQKFGFFKVLDGKLLVLISHTTNSNLTISISVFFGTRFEVQVYYQSFAKLLGL